MNDLAEYEHDVRLPSRERQQQTRQRLFTEMSESLAAFGTSVDEANAFIRDQGYDDLEDWFETQVTEFRRLKLPVPERPGIMRADEWDLDRLLALADQLKVSKLRVEDVTPGLRRFATEWLRALPTPISFEYLAEMRARIAPGTKGKLTIAMAKGVLNCALAEARRARQAKTATPRPEPVPIDDGIYFYEGVVYKVVHAVHGSGKQYAKRLVVPEGGGKGRFEYASGAVFKLRPEHKMTLEQGREFGQLYGMCANCGATLTAEDSIEAGMGPICRGKFA